MPHDSAVIAITGDVCKARSFKSEKSALAFADEQENLLAGGAVDLSAIEVIDEVGDRTHWFVVFSCIKRRIYFA
jgi:hypothetical protein